MPPFLPRKRLSTSPPASSRPTPLKKAKLADVLDAESKSTPGPRRTKTFSLGSDESESSLSDVDSEQFENVSSNLKQPPALTHDDEKEDDDDEDIEWEDAAGPDHEKELPAYKPQSDGPIEITFRKVDNEADNWIAQAANKRKGPSKREKQVRACTHQLHVQFLLWHNSVRNSWISDREVQQILLQQLPPPIKKEIEKWRRASGLPCGETEAGGEPVKGSRGKRHGKQKAADPRDERDWGRPSKRVEQGKPDMSNGDPIISLMKVLAAYWKKRFAVTAPGLRKRGYGTRLGLKQIIQSQRNNDHNPEEHGERIRNVQEFRELARKSEGSRDVGAQLFTALLRGLGIEARLVASLQPSGFGWTKAEQAVPRMATEAVDSDTSFDYSDSGDARPISEINKPARRKGGARKASKNSSELENEEDSVVDITPSMPKKRPQRYDRENPFPIYWTEAISPVTNKVLSVSPLVLASPVATTPEILATFEPRGIKAEKTKTVMAYVIAYSSDGSAKDVTVRYLRKRIWPGKTKGFRFPVEKIPVYNKHGKVKRYEDYDWFKRVMSGYARPDLMRTTVDDVEDATDLVPQLPEKKDNGGQEVDTLQSLKASADYVLERFLRREEALRPNAEPVRTFTSGKGENQKEEPVYRRSDVERCLTAESWHKEGRRPRAGEAPMKLVPVRAVTLTRKREAEEHERQTGEKQMQGLYSWDQTEYIIPPPIQDGVIPKNAYGNIDCFVPSMVPKGAVHIPLRGTVRICKKLQIDFAEAVTGFEFGNKRAVPICTGVVVAKENERAVKEAWHKFNEEQRKKEEKKMESMVLELWRKFVVGLRIRERVRDTYGDQNAADELAVGRSKEQPIMLESDDEALPIPRDVPEARTGTAEDEFGGGGGFLLDSDEEHLVESDLEVVHHHDEPKSPVLNHSGFKGKERATDYQYPTPASVSPLKPPLRRRRPGKSILDEAENSEQESSGLSSPPGEEDGDVGGGEGVDRASDLKSGPDGVDDADDEEDMEGEEDDDDKNSNESGSDDYVPTKAAKRSTSTRKPRRSTSNTASQPSLRRRTRRNTGAATSISSPSLDDRDGGEVGSDIGIDVTTRRSGLYAQSPSTVTSKARRSRAQVGTPARTKRRLRRDSTRVTSPYFQS